MGQFLRNLLIVGLCLAVGIALGTLVSALGILGSLAAFVMMTGLLTLVSRLILGPEEAKLEESATLWMNSALDTDTNLTTRNKRLHLINADLQLVSNIATSLLASGYEAAAELVAKLQVEEIKSAVNLLLTAAKIRAGIKDKE